MENPGKVIYWVRHGEAEHNVVSQAGKDAGLSDWQRRQKMADDALWLPYRGICESLRKGLRKRCGEGQRGPLASLLFGGD